jgi:hypothetical protein
VIQRQYAPGIERTFKRLRIRLPGDVLEQLVDAIAPLEHRVVLFARPDQMRQRKLLARQVKLDRMTEGDLERIILPPRASLEQEFSLLADDEQLGRLARPPREFGDRIHDADVVMREDDRQFFQGKDLAGSAPAGLPRPRNNGRALSALMDRGRSEGLLHGKSLNKDPKIAKTRLYEHRPETKRFGTNPDCGFEIEGILETRIRLCRRTRPV